MYTLLVAYACIAGGTYCQVDSGVTFVLVHQMNMNISLKYGALLIFKHLHCNMFPISLFLAVDPLPSFAVSCLMQ